MFKRDTGKCKGFLFIEMYYQKYLALFQSVSKVETFRGNYKGFTKNDVVKAISARKAQSIIGSPSEKEFKELVGEN